MWQSTKEIKAGCRKWICRNCGSEQYEEPPQGLKVPPKILYVDIEYGKMKVWIYDLYSKQNTHINKDMIDRLRFVTNWAAAWVNPSTCKIQGQIITGVVSQREAKKANDKRILRPLFDLMSASDYVCGHNVSRFDIKVLKWRYLYNGMGYPLESKVVDTFKLSGKGRPESRAMDFLLKQLGHEGKKHKLYDEEWKEICEFGTPRLLKKADRYCRADVRGGVNLLREYALAEQRSGKVLFR